MKKLFALILALAMVFSLAACGGSTNDLGTASKSDTPAASGAAPSSADASDSAAPVGDPINLKFSNAYGETDTQGILFTWWQEYITEKSGGTITFTNYWSGTLGSSSEEMDMLKDGNIDCCALTAAGYAPVMPAFCVIQQGVGSVAEVSEYYENLCYNADGQHEEIANLFAEELQTYNAVMLHGFITNGNNWWCTSRTDSTSYTDLLTKAKIGAASTTGLIAMGFENAIAVDATAQYENIRTGLIDTCTGNAAQIINSRWYEVINAVIENYAYSAGEWLVMNQDTWNKLSPEQQEIFYEAGDALVDHVTEYQAEMQAQFDGVLEENGIVKYAMSDEEFEQYFRVVCIQGWSNLHSGLGPASGKQEDVDLALKYVMDYIQSDEYWGLDYGATVENCDDLWAEMAG